MLISLGWRGVVRVGDSNESLEPGLALVATNDETHECLRIHAPGALLILRLGGGNLPCLGPGALGPRALPIQSDLLDELAERPVQTIANSNATKLHLLATQIASRLTVQPPRRDILALNLRRRLESELEGKRSIRSLLDEARADPYRILRAFKGQYGVPPAAYQLALRLQLARQALEAGRAPVGVAAECGFADQSHLCRQFKRWIGTTPTDYVQACQKGVLVVLGAAAAKASRSSASCPCCRSRTLSRRGGLEICPVCF